MDCIPVSIKQYASSIAVLPENSKFLETSSKANSSVVSVLPHCGPEGPQQLAHGNQLGNVKVRIWRKSAGLQSSCGL